MLKICQSFFLCSTQQMCSLKHLLTSNSTHLVLCHSYCVVPEKNPYTPHGRSLEIPRVKGLSKGKILEAKYEAKLKSLVGGGGAKQKKPSVEGVKIFSGTTHYTCNQYPKCRERYWSSSIMCR